MPVNAVAAGGLALGQQDLTVIPVPDAQGDMGYRATRSSRSTKTGTPLPYVPKSISVVRDKQIKDNASAML